MTMVTDLLHFLDEDGHIAQMTPEATRLARFLTEVVESASENYALPLFFADTECIQVADKKLCGGDVEVWIYAESNNIGWECVECAATGIISNWEGSLWDKRDYTRH